MKNPTRCSTLLLSPLLLSCLHSPLLASSNLETMVDQLRARRPALTMAQADVTPVSVLPENQLRFSTGEVVQGRITAIQDGVVTFSAFRTEGIQADLADLIDVRGTDVLHIGLSDGSTLQGQFRSSEVPASFQVLTEVGSVEVNKAQIARVATLDAIAAEEADLREKATVRLTKYWKGYGDVGYTSSSGNADISDARIQMEATRTTAVDKFRLNIFTQNSDANGSKTVEKTFGEARMDVYMKNNLFYFMQGRLESDKIRNLDLRTAIGAGLGTRLVDREDLAISFGLGYSFIREAFKGGLDDSQGTMLITLDTDWQLSDQISFEQRISANPDFSSNDLLVKSQSTLKSRLSEDLSFTLGYNYNYDKIPPAGAEGRDVTITSGLRKDF